MKRSILPMLATLALPKVWAQETANIFTAQHEQQSYSATASQLSALSATWVHREPAGIIGGNFNIEIVITGSPSAMSTTINGCMRGSNPNADPPSGTCKTLATSTSTTSNVQSVSGPYDYYTVSSTWTGTVTALRYNLTGIASSQNSSGGSGNATTINGAAVPANANFLASNGSSQLQTVPNLSWNGTQSVWGDPTTCVTSNPSQSPWYKHCGAINNATTSGYAHFVTYDGTVTSGTSGCVNTAPSQFTANWTTTGPWPCSYAIEDMRAGLAGSANAEHWLGVQAGHQTLPGFTGTVNRMIGFAPIMLVNGGTINNWFGMYVPDINKAGGTVTTGYGVYIDTMSAAATNYAFYARSNPAFLGGGFTSTALPLYTALANANNYVAGLGTTTPNSFNGVALTTGTNFQIGGSSANASPRMILNATVNGAQAEAHFVNTNAPAGSQAWRGYLTTGGHWILDVSSSGYAASKSAYDCSGSATTSAGCVFPNPVGQTVGSAVASSATIAPTAAIFHVTGTTAISTMTAPIPLSSTVGGCLNLIADGAWSITAGTGAGQFKSSLGPVTVGNRYQFCYDGTLWY